MARYGGYRRDLTVGVTEGLDHSKSKIASAIIDADVSAMWRPGSASTTLTEFGTGIVPISRAVACRISRDETVVPALFEDWARFDGFQVSWKGESTGDKAKEVCG